jgi:hypothetical protein
MFIARSLSFYPGTLKEEDGELSDEIIVPAYYLNRLMEQFEDNETLYVILTNIENEQNYIVAIGSPHSFDKNTVFVPQWILDLIGCSDNSNSIINIKKANMNSIPKATKIIIKPLDPIAFEIDTLACFEKALMNIHSIKEGITFPINVAELGKDYIIYAYIEKVEPEPLSLIVHGEVDVEFINDFENKSIQPDMNNQLESTSNIINELDNSTMIPESYSAPQNQTISVEDRRRQVRDSWVKRFQNISA